MKLTKNVLAKFAQSWLRSKQVRNSNVRPLQQAASNFLKAILLITIFSGCATLAPKSFSEFKEGQWQGKAVIHDKKANKRGLVNLKIKAIDNEKMRIDVTSAIGTHVASVLLNKEGVEYLNVSEKALVRAKSGKNALREILKVSIEPQVLYNVFFDRAIEDKNWTCALENEVIKSCKEKSGLKIDWVSREGIKRNIEIDSSSASIHMNLYDFDKKVSDPDKAFTLKVPASFQIKYL